jgi:N-hydroxyarylamine O-acetyltransferase
MQAKNFDLKSYLSRIGFQGEAKADLGTLTKLMQLQLRSVPFENLDVQAGKVVSLVPEDIVQKIVSQRRGGYCYEVNGLFAMALDALGISYFFVAARPMFYAERRPKTHMAILVKLGDQTWLCDLGFGSYGLRAPLSMGMLDVELHQDQDKFMLSQLPDQEYLLQACIGEQWTAQYSYSLVAQEWLDFAPANYMNSTHPEAIFVKQLLVILQTSEGRKILSGCVLKNWAHGNLTQQGVVESALSVVLREEFGIDVIGIQSLSRPECT